MGSLQRVGQPDVCRLANVGDELDPFGMGE
ncbi:hypothetical protein I41_23370 [Lacipirellula limnantheis]|uniref:Uncharacterized protein n=1 Tax=Lacipirellula limnantheis TaxID=2528024 RepID=A0A517TXP4_9BACT|nr:hypothetical protein I41_23370 [Lacipirellula limnantheis]